ncbi:MAG: hypothetical protein COC04_04920 [Gammaproteobacteria bacterium]|nr:MAG: hypothetical protein COC04_04920 [Gammaproteobacteria bacterium]
MAENEGEEILETEKVDDQDGSEAEGDEAGGGSFLDKIKRKLNFFTSRKDKEGSESEGEEADGDSDDGKIKSKFNLSTSLLIKIAIGLAVLIIAVGGYLFFTSGDEQVENELSSETVEQDVMTDADDVSGEIIDEIDPGEKTAAEALGEISQGVTDPKDAPAAEMTSEEGIDLAPLPDASTALSSDENDIMLPATPGMPDISGAVVALPETVDMPVEDAKPLTPEDKAMELFKLREKALILEEENRRLKQRLSTAEGQNYSEGAKPKASKPREREPELSKPTWGDFSPIYRGP